MFPRKLSGVAQAAAPMCLASAYTHNIVMGNIRHRANLRGLWEHARYCPFENHVMVRKACNEQNIALIRPEKEKIRSEEEIS